MSNAVFPSLIGQDWTGTKTPVFATQVQRAVSGKELRLAYMNFPLWKFTVGYEVLRSDGRADLQTIVGFFLSRQGMFDTFLYSDPNENPVTAQSFGTGDGTAVAYQLLKSVGGFVEPVQNLNGSPQIFVSDWKGNQLQFSTPRTNLALQSEDLSSVTWSKTNVTVTTDTTLAPDGNTTADSILETAVSGTHFIQQSFTKAASALQYTLKFWCKPINGRNTFRAQINDQGANAAAADIDMGAVTASVTGAGFTGVTASIAAANNGAFLVTIQGTSNALTTLAILFQTTNPAGTTSFLGDVTKGIVIWGVDLKQSSVVNSGSYIKTTTVAVTVTDYTLSTLGVVTLSPAPLVGAALTWSGNFYYRCRFTQDTAEFNEFVNNFWTLKKIEFQSVKL